MRDGTLIRSIKKMSQQGRKGSLNENQRVGHVQLTLESEQSVDNCMEIFPLG